MRYIHIRLIILIGLLSVAYSACRLDSASVRPDLDNLDITGAKVYNIDTAALERFRLDCSIRAIAPLDEMTCWYAGSRGQYGFTIDGGDSWTIDSLQHPAIEQLEFRSIVVTEHSVFLLSIGSPALLYKSGDLGITWDIVYQEDDSLAFYDAMAFWDNDEGIAMGDPTEGCLSVIKTVDGGKSWTKISCDRLPQVTQGEAAFAASNSNIALYEDHVWIVSGGQKARVLHSSDRGVSWNIYDTPIVQGGQMTGIFSCDFFNQDTGVIFGGDWNNQKANKANKAITKDGGISWSLIADGSHPGYRSCVQYIDDNSPDYIIAVGIPGISYSADGGHNWKAISDESFYTFRKAGNVIWLAGRDKMARLKL